jgi:hypothetical protein
MRKVADIRNRKEQRFLAFGVDVLGLLLESRGWVVEGEGCNILKVDSTFLSIFISISPSSSSPSSRSLLAFDGLG